MLLNILLIIQSLQGNCHGPEKKDSRFTNIYYMLLTGIFMACIIDWKYLRDLVKYHVKWPKVDAAEITAGTEQEGKEDDDNEGKKEKVGFRKRKV
ncbi:unnamed protein product, partial [Darwinula stevensoni]